MHSASLAPELSAILSRSEEHTSEFQSHSDLVCRLLLEKKKKKTILALPIHKQQTDQNKIHYRFQIGFSSFCSLVGYVVEGLLYLLVAFFFFFFNDTATTEIYTLSLHDALPINARKGGEGLPQPGHPSTS